MGQNIYFFFPTGAFLLSMFISDGCPIVTTSSVFLCLLLFFFNVLGLSSLCLNSLGSRSYVTKFHAQLYLARPWWRFACLRVEHLIQTFCGY